jgi:hypothetical protein
VCVNVEISILGITVLLVILPVLSENEVTSTSRMWKEEGVA